MPEEDKSPAKELSDQETLYGIADEAMRECIEIYLRLTEETQAFSKIKKKDVQDIASRVIVLAGFNSSLDASNTTPEEIIAEWQRLRAVAFETERAITAGVYLKLRSKVVRLLDELDKATNHFASFDAQYISAHPYMLPLLQRLANIASKADLKKRVGQCSDHSISPAVAKKISEILNQRQPGKGLGSAQILQSIEPTLEGIVRDLVGRVLLETIVANALDKAGVRYKRESEYQKIKGVVYDFRADFVIPDDINPKAFIEVRKSSSRHASLYAKDKMFSAINWKGKRPDLLAVLVVEGPWTNETLKAMTKVFDYVVPLSTVSDVATAIREYVNGDKSKLKWLINFSISEATHTN